jgi:hypothetical protein
MRRLTIAVGLVAGLAIAVPAASGFEVGAFNYRGPVKGDTIAQVGFKRDKDSNGHTQVLDFTVTQPPITCSNSSSTRSNDGYEFDLILRVKHREFEGKGEWLVLALDPSGTVAGKFSRDRQKAHGTFKIHGELAGDGTKCHTGELEWRATKVTQP